MGVFQWAGITCSTDGGTINRFDGTTFSSFNLTNTTLVTNTTPLSAGGAHIACSSDGKKIFVCTTAAGGHNVAMSPDGGTTWQSWPVGGSSNNMIDGVACSADGTKVIIGGGGVVGFWLGSH
jgi:DNA-binding beta-propeller fold protein YncE